MKTSRLKMPLCIFLSVGFILLLTSCGGSAVTPTPIANVSTATPAETINPPTEGIKENELHFILPAYPDDSHLYYVDLLEQSLEATGYEVTIETTIPLPQKRAIQMLDQNQISMIHLIHTQERDQMYTPVEVGLTNGLIGQRILLVRPEDVDSYANVQTLADFRALNQVGAFGQGWFDVAVWQANDLSFVEVDGEWRKIYDMLALEDRNIDYFSRGFTEILNEAKEHSELAVEQHLTFVYNRDFQFYLSEEASGQKIIIEQALRKARQDGLMDSLIRQYWTDHLKMLNFDQRTRLALITPEK